MAMAINNTGVSNAYEANYASETKDVKGKKQNKSTENAEQQQYSQDVDTAAVYEKGKDKTSELSESRVQQLLNESNKQIEDFKEMIQKMLDSQSEKFYAAHPKEELTQEGVSGRLKEVMEDMEVDEATRTKAQADIAEDGYWGVKQTSERILGFAKSLAGGDPSKIDLLYSAVEEGFKQAEKMWGAELPEISKQTFEAVKKGFEDWKNEEVAKNTANQVAAQATMGLVGVAN